MQVVLSKGVDEGKILFLSLIAAPEGIHMVCKKFPRVKVITSEIDDGIDESTFQVIPGVHTISGDTSVSLTVPVQLQSSAHTSQGLWLTPDRGRCCRNWRVWRSLLL